MGTHAQEIDIRKSFTFPQNIECEEPPSLSSNEVIFQSLSEEIYNFLTPLRQVFQKFWPPSSLDHAPTDGLKWPTPYMYIHIYYTFIYIYSSYISKNNY